MTFSRAIVLAGGISLTMTGLAMLAPALAAGTALDGTAILPAPSLGKAHMLPASAATSGVAAVSAAQDGPLQDCSRRNPCAMPTPARDRVTVGAGQAAVGKHSDVNDAEAARPKTAGAGDLRS
jgi:hypothetical protein